MIKTRSVDGDETDVSCVVGGRARTKQHILRRPVLFNLQLLILRHSRPAKISMNATPTSTTASRLPCAATGTPVPAPNSSACVPLARSTPTVAPVPVSLGVACQCASTCLSQVTGLSGCVCFACYGSRAARQTWANVFCFLPRLVLTLQTRA